MLDSNTLSTYKSLKNKRDAAYRVLKLKPSVEHTSRHMAAMQEFNDFCIKTITRLAEQSYTEPDKQKEILENLDDYLVCKQCGAELLYPVDDGKSFIASSDFEEYFPGWCHSCLVEHCCNTDCKMCSVAPGDIRCPFIETKNIYMQEQ